MASPNALKRAEQIKHIAAEMLEKRVKDTRLGFVTITDVRLSKDSHDCTLFYTVLGTDEERADTAAALEAARGQIRTAVSRRLGLRFAPTITFVADAMPETSAHMEELLAQARAVDEKVAAQAVGATYAGEPDPYRKPADDDDTDE
ncbi:MAG TPA: 30S ribosome-binding factor RbfA [Propionibacteriaceae bacterium]|nr:30S ribosome-binding factor RbfA [Propionibacteriaceae bacterium]